MKTFLLFVFIPFLIYAQIQSGSIRINEFMASNSSALTDNDGEYSDWIEIYNPDDNDVNLSGWSLTDDKEDLQKWIFPDVVLKANSYLIIFASGKNLSDTNGELHTNFKLNADGEYLAIVNNEGNVLSEFDPYPVQYNDVSYSFFENDFVYSTTPTPGKENIITGDKLIPAPVFNYKHGYFENPFNLEITSTLLNSNIYYTTDGSEPDVNNGILYSSPVLINTTTILRAINIKAGLKSRITTATYIFPDSVINQPNNPSGYPNTWGPYTAISGTAIADYEMDPEITRDPKYSGLIKESLLSLPVISIVTDKNNLFSKSIVPEKGGIYIYTGPPGNGDVPQLGIDWERPASIEFFNANGTKELQADCGLRIHGGHSRRPEKSPKHAFRIIFRKEYGISKLNFPLFGEDVSQTFNTFILRAGYGNTWIHMNNSERVRMQLIRDIWGKDTQLDMGDPSGHNTYVQLYLNGMYWGIYNPTERIDKDFAKDYLGGNEDDYDIIKDYSEVVDGNITAWNAMLKLANMDMTNNAYYQRIQGKNRDGTINPSYEPYIDVENLIDYMILNFYGANWDWDHHNWIAIRNRIEPGKGFKFFSWDAEHILEDVSSSVLNEDNDNCPSHLFQQLLKNPDFKKLFADRVQLHCFNGGALTYSSALKRWMKRSDEVEPAIIAESARWGDYRRDVHNWAGGPYYLYDKEFWLDQKSFMVNQYFPNRTKEFIKQLRQAGMFPGIDAPAFIIDGKPVEQKNINTGDIFSMTVPSGTIYYTIDGSDPDSAEQPSVNAMVYSNSFQLNHSTHIKARTLQGNEWSALSEMLFELPSDLNYLKITEINYHPLPEDTISDNLFEFIELKNTGDSPLDLSGIKFCNGISYSFPFNTILNSKKFVVLASNKFYFKQRYGFTPFDQYTGLLNNSGEKIVLENSAGDTLISIKYNDKDPWPIEADGEGYSLVTKEPDPAGDLNLPENWRKSIYKNGSPGKDDESSSDVIVNNNELVETFRLFQNFPNPFNPETFISYTIPEAGFVTLKVYNVLGREVATLINEKQASGRHLINFSSKNFKWKLSSGIYFYQLNFDNKIFLTKKMILLK